MIENKKTLFIGAHPDDVFISSAITILSKPENAYVLTLTDGAPRLKEYYPFSADNGMIFENPENYAKIRLRDDLNVMKQLGLKESNYFNPELADQGLHLATDEICSIIDKIINKHGITQIVTHEYPQSHPDHEIASIIALSYGKKHNIETWCYPMYKINSQGIKVFGEFDLQKESFIKEFTPEEFTYKDKIIQLYDTEIGIRDRYKTFREVFFKETIDTINIEEKTPYIKEILSVKPEDIRKILKNYL